MKLPVSLPEQCPAPGSGAGRLPIAVLRKGLGAEGVVHLLRSMPAEADLIMAIDAYPTIKDRTPGALRRVG